MARYGWGGDQWFDNNGEPLSGGKIYFYEPGTTTEKDTFSDEGETSANANPVVLDAAGRQGDIFFTGQAKVVVRDADGVHIDTTDPVGGSSTGGSLEAWDSSRTYAINDLVQGSNGLYYQSNVNGNVNHNPTSAPAYWQEVRFVGVYNAARSYLSRDIAYYSDVLWLSLSSSNAGNTPAQGSTHWKPLNTDLSIDLAPKIADFTAAAGRHYLIDTSGGAFTMLLPASPANGDRVGFTDYGESFNTNYLTLGRNSQEIMNLAEDMDCDVRYFTGSLTFTTARGWIFR